MALAVYVGSAVWSSPALVVLATVLGPRFCGVTAVAVPAAVCRRAYQTSVLSAGVASEPMAKKKMLGSTAAEPVRPRTESVGLTTACSPSMEYLRLCAYRFTSGLHAKASYLKAPRARPRPSSVR